MLLFLIYKVVMHEYFGNPDFIVPDPTKGYFFFFQYWEFLLVIMLCSSLLYEFGDFMTRYTKVLIEIGRSYADLKTEILSFLFSLVIGTGIVYSFSWIPWEILKAAIAVILAIHLISKILSLSKSNIFSVFISQIYSYFFGDFLNTVHLISLGCLLFLCYN